MHSKYISALKFKCQVSYPLNDSFCNGVPKHTVTIHDSSTINIMLLEATSHVLTCRLYYVSVSILPAFLYLVLPL